MAYSISCSNCGRSLKDHWLVCKYCHKPRWNIIWKYLLYGTSALMIAFAIILLDKGGSLSCAAAVIAALGGVLLLIGAVGTLLGLTARKKKTEAGPATPASTSTPSNHPDKPHVMPPFVDRLGSFVGTDQMRISNIDNNIRMANNEPQWNQLNLVPGQVERGQIPVHMRETIDYLVDSHLPTSKLTFEHLLKLGSDQLRETIIRVLGAMGTDNVLSTLEAFTRMDPLRVNEDEQYNQTSGPYAEISFSWVMPLRKLAQEQLHVVKSRLGKS